MVVRVGRDGCRLAWLGIGLAIVGCGGGGGGSSPVPPSANAGLPPAASPTPKPSVAVGGVNPTPSPSGKPGATPSPGTSSTPTARPTGAAPSPTPTASPTATPKPTPSPAPSSTPGFVDWPTYGFDNLRDGYNPDSTAITASSIVNLHPGWAPVATGDFDTQTQPIIATGIVAGGQRRHAVIFVGGGSGTVYAFDAFTGGRIWTQSLPQGQYYCGKNPGVVGGTPAIFGVGGTPVYDRSRGALYASDGVHTIHALAAGSGALGLAGDIAPGANDALNLREFLHTSLTLLNGKLYAGTGSTCDLSPWRGRLAELDAASMTVVGTYYPVYDPNAARPYSGGGVWGWGGASTDGSSLYIGAGNADVNPGGDQPSPPPPFLVAPSEFQNNGEHIVQLSTDLSAGQGSVRAANYPGFSFGGLNPEGQFRGDLDFSGTPVLFAPLGCPLMSASQGKAGELVIYDARAIGNGPVARFQLSQVADTANYIGNPGYSPVTGLLYAAVSSVDPDIIEPRPGMVAIAPSGGCSSFRVVWYARFGPDSFFYGNDQGGATSPRSAPTVTAGGVVLMGTPDGAAGNPSGAVYAIDAQSGAVLNGGAPILRTGGPVRMAPVVDGDWIFVFDNNGNLYSLTVDPNFARSSVRRSNLPFGRR